MRFVSIIGDSLSTYQGFNPKGYSVFYWQEVLEANGMTSPYDTWWAKVNQALHAYLCVNNSYSGSRVSGKEFPSATCDERLDALRTEQYSPDIILIYIGFNDYGYGVPLRRWDGAMFYPKRDLTYFEDAYDVLLKKTAMKYPAAKIVCGTLMRSRIRDNDEWEFPRSNGYHSIGEYNDVIREAVRHNRCFLADVGAEDIRYETLDGAHATVNGHKTLADAWIKHLAETGLL